MTWHSDVLSPLHAAVLLWIAGAFALLLCVMIARALYKAKEPSFAKLVGWLRANYVPLFICVGGGLVVLAFVFYLWEIGLLVSRVVDILRLDTADRVIVPVDFRNYATGIALLLGALAAGATLLFQLIRVWINERTANTAEQGMITDRINKAVEGLGAEKTVKRRVQSSDGTLTYEEATEPNLEVRVGAVLALERIAKNSPDDHIQIMEILCAYIRENACIVDVSSTEEADWRQRIDTQTAINVIGRRSPDLIKLEDMRLPPYHLDLRGSNLQRAHLARGNFQNASFDRALLSRSNLKRCDLSGAVLESANISGARMFRANLSDARLDHADLTNATLAKANLSRSTCLGTTFTDALLSEADFSNAQLTGSSFQGSTMYRADLSGVRGRGACFREARLAQSVLISAKLSSADFKRADLRRANLTRANIGGADFSETRLAGATLSRAFLRKTSLKDAGLLDMVLSDVDLRRAKLAGAMLRSIDLTKNVRLEQWQLNLTFGVREGYGACVLHDLSPPEHWHDAAHATSDSGAAFKLFTSAYKKWRHSCTD